MAEVDPTSGVREDEDDHDLLTYGEVGARLHEEIAKEQARLATLSGDGAAAVRDRIAALTDAAERYREHRINANTYERFFGFAPRARG